MSDQPSTQPRHVVVLAHPSSTSFNAAVAQTYCDTVRECGQQVVLRDLYTLGFDPVLRQVERAVSDAFHLLPDVQAELDAIRGADVYVLVYPIWFGTPPAMMKGYVERVLGAGVTAGDVQHRIGTVLLAGRRLLSFTSSASHEPWLAEVGQDISLRTVFDRYLAHAFAMKPPEHVHFGGIVEGCSARFVDQSLYEVHAKARNICATVLAEHHAAAARA